LLTQRRHDRCRKRGGACRRLDSAHVLETLPSRPEPTGDDDDAEQAFYKFLWLEHFREPLFWPLTMLRYHGQLTAEEAANVLHLSDQAVYAVLRRMQKMWLEYDRLSDSAKQARVDVELVRRRRLFEEALAERQRDIDLRAGLGS
jgi:DNA-directed RNA polymerase specialized sigma24 family protein